MGSGRWVSCSEFRFTRFHEKRRGWKWAVLVELGDSQTIAKVQRSQHLGLTIGISRHGMVYEVYYEKWPVRLRFRRAFTWCVFWWFNHFSGSRHFFGGEKSLLQFSGFCQWYVWQWCFFSITVIFFMVTSFFLVGGDWNHGILWLSIYWECHHPNWRTHIFQRGGYTRWCPHSYKLVYNPH